MAKKGIDVSRFNGVVNYVALKQAGIDFVIPRCGAAFDGCKYGDTYSLDPYFLKNVQNALAAGIEVNDVYHWIDGDCTSDARQCAATAINNVHKAGLPKTTVIWCDMEYSLEQIKYRGLTYAKMAEMGKAFCDYCLEQGYPTGIYTNLDYIFNAYGKDIFDKYDIWFAHWETEKPYYEKIVYWQSGTITINGIVFDYNTYYGVYTAGTAKPKTNENDNNNNKTNGKGEIKMSKYQIMTDEQWVDKMIELASGKTPSDYKNWFPWNLLYFYAGRWSADCHNLQKALFNGRDINYKVNNSYQADLSATGDCTEYGLLLQCSDIQWNNFKTLKAGEPRILYKEGHVGAYLGKELKITGQGTVNCVESTPAWEDGIQYSYVAPDGARAWSKEEYQRGNIRAYWQAHGLASKWVVYTDDATQAVVKEYITTVKEEVKGTHYGTSDLAVMIIRNKFGNGYEVRKANLNAQGYTDAEVRSAQDLVNKVVKKANEQKQEAEMAYTIIVAAYDVIAGLYGDGEERKQALVQKYGEEMRSKIQAKVEELLG